MSETLIDRLTKTADGMRLYQQERAIQELTDLLCEIMEEDGVSRSDLARRLGKSKGYITQLLDGRSNMTVRTISDVFGALNRALHFQDGPLELTARRAPQLLFRATANWADHQPAWPKSPTVAGGLRSSAEKLAG
jgi:transcriptional regulator with XRE-family HTH domain